MSANTTLEYSFGEKVTLHGRLNRSGHVTSGGGVVRVFSSHFNPELF